MLEGLLYLTLPPLLPSLLLLLVLFLISLFIFLFPLCASRLSTRQSKIERPLAARSDSDSSAQWARLSRRARSARASSHPLRAWSDRCDRDTRRSAQHISVSCPADHEGRPWSWRSRQKGARSPCGGVLLRRRNRGREPMRARPASARRGAEPADRE